MSDAPEAERDTPTPRLGQSPSTAAFLDRVEVVMHRLLDLRTGPVVDAARQAVSAGGKRLRPLLVLAAAPHPDHRPSDELVAAAAAVELIHTASLVHDDLIDGASLRRGSPTGHAQFGERVAVAAGDLLFSLAFRCLLDCHASVPADALRDAVHRTAQAARTLAEGEALQERQAGDATLPIDSYLDRCAHKTGELFGLAMELAALLGGGAPADVEVLGRFGRQVGTAFQVADDVLDCAPAGEAARLGKVPGADLRDRTMTLPILLAVQRDAELATALAAGPPGDLHDALGRIAACGALRDAHQHARELADASLLLLDALGNAYDRDSLRLAAAMSVERLA